MFNRQLLQYKFNLKARSAKVLAFIYTEIATRMLDRLDYIKLTPAAILDIGSGLDIDAQLLAKKYPAAQVYHLDFALNALQLAMPKYGLIKRLWHKNRNFVCGDALQLPLQAKSMDIVWSNLILPYIDDYTAYFKEIRRALKVGGCFLVSGLGVDSLEQLREIGLATYDFPDMHMIGDILVKLGFTNPVMDMDKITLEYDNLDLLLKDVRILGIGAAAETRNAPLKRHQYAGLQAQFTHKVHADKFPLTLEVLYAHAWKDNEQLELPAGHKSIKFFPKK